MTDVQPHDIRWGECSRSPDPAVRRRAAAEAVEHLGPDDAVQILSERFLVDPVWTVREAAARSLTDLLRDPPPEFRTAVPALRRVALSDRVIHVRTAAVEAIVAGPEREDSIACFRRAFEASRSTIRCRALRALGHALGPSQEWVDLMRVALKDSDARVRWVALRLIGQLKTPAAPLISEIERRCQDRDPRVATEASVLNEAKAFDQVRHPDAAKLAEQRLMQLWEPPEESDRAAAGEFLATCRRRAEWNRRVRGADEAALDETVTPVEAARHVVRALRQGMFERKTTQESSHRAARSADRSAEREWAWLLRQSRNLLHGEE